MEVNTVRGRVGRRMPAAAKSARTSLHGREKRKPGAQAPAVGDVVQGWPLRVEEGRHERSARQVSGTAGRAGESWGSSTALNIFVVKLAGFCR